MLGELFGCFLQVGLFSFGGGMVAITLLMQKLVTEKGWMDAGAFTDLIAIAESTPGPIAVNAATFVGMRLAGVPGMLLATLGAVLPGCVVVLVLAALYRRYQNLSLVKGMMEGLRPAIVAIIFAGGFAIFRNAVFQSGVLSLGALDWQSAVLFGLACVLVTQTRLNAATVILGCGAVGCLLRLLAQ